MFLLLSLWNRLELVGQQGALHGLRRIFLNKRIGVNFGQLDTLALTFWLWLRCHVYWAVRDGWRFIIHLLN